MLTTRLRYLRKEKKLTQDEVAKIIGIKRAGYSSYETGRVEPSNEVLSKLADFYDTTIDYIMMRTDERSRTKGTKYDEVRKSSNLKKIIKETALTWDGEPITADQVDALIAFYETLTRENTKRKKKQ